MRRPGRSQTKKHGSWVRIPCSLPGMRLNPVNFRRLSSAVAKQNPVGLFMPSPEAGPLPSTSTTRSTFLYIAMRQGNRCSLAFAGSHGLQTKAGKHTDLSGIQLGQTIDMMQMASVVSANVEA